MTTRDDSSSWQRYMAMGRRGTATAVAWRSGGGRSAGIGLRPGERRRRGVVVQGWENGVAAGRRQRRGEGRRQRRRAGVAEAERTMFKMMQHRVERRLDRRAAVERDIFDAVGGADLDGRAAAVDGGQRVGNRRRQRVEQYRETRDP